MDERVVQFRVGVVVLATAIITAILILLFQGAPPIVHGHYTIYIELPRAPGVSIDTPIRKSGIFIGRVADIQFADNDQGVIVTASILGDKKIATDEICQVRSSLLGDAVLEFTPPRERPADRAPPDETPPASGQTSQRPPTQYLQPGDTVKGRVLSDPLEVFSTLEPDLAGAVESIRTAGEGISRLSAGIEDLLPKTDEEREKFSRLLTEFRTALEGITKTTTAINNIVGDPKVQENVRIGADKLREIIENAGPIVAKFEETVELVNGTLANLKHISDPSGELAGMIRNMLDVLDQTFREALTFVESLNRSDGTLNQLVENPELYQNLNRTVASMEELMRQLRPILDDVRIFTDKIARDPGRLGVRGACGARAESSSGGRFRARDGGEPQSRGGRGGKNSC